MSSAPTRKKARFYRLGPDPAGLLYAGEPEDGRNRLLEACFCNQISLTWMQYSHEWVGSIRGGRRVDRLKMVG
jgi:hypothetical protein